MNDSEENESVSRHSPFRPCFGAESEGVAYRVPKLLKLVIVTLLAKLLLMERP